MSGLRAAHEAPAPVPPYARRARLAASEGLGAGMLAGVALALAEMLAIARHGLGSEAQLLWWGPLVYAVGFGALGALGGAVLAALPIDPARARGRTASLALFFTLVPLGFANAVSRVDASAHPGRPSAAELAPLALAFTTLALLLLGLGPRLLRSRLGKLLAPPNVVAVVILAAGGGWIAASELAHRPPTPRAASAAPAVGRPNLILVMADSLRADSLTCYGGRLVPTPSTCRLAADGGTFYDGFSHASSTKPATATLLTGLVPSSHRTVSKADVLPSEIVTLAEALRGAGYATGAFLSSPELREELGFAQGFDEFRDLPPDTLLGAAESSSQLTLHRLLRRVRLRLTPGLRVGDFYQDSAVVNQRAFAFLERRARSPFFLFLHYMDAHDPYFQHPYDGVGIARAAQAPPPSQASRLRALYAGEIAHLDASMGQLIEKLEALGLYDDTVIAFVADHGEELQDHGGFWHGGTLYDELLRVPLMIKWRKGAPAAPPDARGEPARLIDVAPTLLAQAGAEVPAAMQGIDLAQPPATRAARDRVVLAEERCDGSALTAVRTRTWKWVEAGAGNPRGLPPRELFRVESDPGEHENLAEEEPGTAREMEQLAAEMLRAAKAAPVGAPGAGAAGAAAGDGSGGPLPGRTDGTSRGSD